MSDNASFKVTFRKERTKDKYTTKRFEKILTVCSAMSFQYGIGLPFLLVRRISFVSHVNVLAVGFGFCLIHRLDEVPSVISLHVTSLRERCVMLPIII